MIKTISAMLVLGVLSVANAIGNTIDSSTYGNIEDVNWFSNLSYPGNLGNMLFPISHMVEIRAAGQRLQGLGSGGFRDAWILFGVCFWICLTCPILGNHMFL